MFQQKDSTVRRGSEYFPRIVDSLNDLPEPVRAAVGQTSIRQIIHIPSQEYPVRRTFWHHDLTFGWRRTPPRTLIFNDEQIIIVEGMAEDSLRTVVIPLADLLSIRLVSVLLYMYLELGWLCADRTETIKLEFNAVGERMIARELDQVRATIAARLTPSDPIQEASIKHFPFKFQSYTYGDLLPGEQIMIGVYEPRIRTTNQYLRTYMSPNRVVVLTDRHLLVLEDRNRLFSEADLSSYWMERCFYPRAHIRDIRFESQPNVTWVDVCLTGQDIRLPLLEPRVAALREAVERWLVPAGLQLK